MRWLHTLCGLCLFSVVVFFRKYFCVTISFLFVCVITTDLGLIMESPNSAHCHPLICMHYLLQFITLSFFKQQKFLFPFPCQFVGVFFLFFLPFSFSLSLSVSFFRIYTYRTLFIKKQKKFFVNSIIGATAATAAVAATIAKIKTKGNDLFLSPFTLFFHYSIVSIDKLWLRLLIVLHER